jgi:glycosyltransferase involved in cell wall biosynthesis
VGLVERLQALQAARCLRRLRLSRAESDGTFFGSPTKLFEHGLRKTIVASDLGQIGEILSDGQTALLCAPGDVEQMASAVRRLPADADLRDRLADAAFELASSRYTWTAHVRRILDALAAKRAPAARP